MEFKKRTIKFKAWDEEHRLLMRLHSIDCNKGELVKKNHILLQFTGLCDMDYNEIYEMDVLLNALEKFLVVWNDSKNGWYYCPVLDKNILSPLLPEDGKKMKRICSFFELQK